MTKEIFITENWSDPDDAPKITQEWADGADAFRDGKIIRRGRPKLETTKKHVSLRLDPAVLERYQAEGPGWQARINEDLKKAVGL
jgi:uncharacterized protein (DUF4415 family)